MEREVAGNLIFLESLKFQRNEQNKNINDLDSETQALHAKITKLDEIRPMLDQFILLKVNNIYSRTSSNYIDLRLCI